MIVREVVVFPDGRMDAKNTSTYLGVAEKTMAIWRSSGAGPPYVKRGRIFYFKDDLDKWIEEGRRTSTAKGCSAAKISQEGGKRT